MKRATEMPEVCSYCHGDASGLHGLPYYNGDLVSNDWPVNWAMKPSCEDCHDKHAAGRLPVWDHLYSPLLGLMYDGGGI